MSDNYLKFIPENTTFVPNIEAQEEAKSFLTSVLPDADSITFTTSSEIRFYDAGGNFERILCPYCAHEIEITWWQEEMNKANESGFRALEVKLPCCSRKSSLNELLYDWPQGFARFCVEVYNPNVKDISNQWLEKLKNILGCNFKVIWQHI